MHRSDDLIIMWVLILACIGGCSQDRPTECAYHAPLYRTVQVLDGYEIVEQYRERSESTGTVTIINDKHDEYAKDGME